MNENNSLQIFDNPEFGKVRVIEKDGEPWFVLKDVCETFGETNHRRVSGRLDDDEKGVSQIATLGGNQNMTIINESGLYSALFIMQPKKARNVDIEYIESRQKQLKKFKRWVTNEVIPSIRKHGAYMTPEKLEEVLLNPDTLIQLAQNLKTEQEARKKAEKELAFKNDVIQGLVDDIPLADKRRRISQIIRKGCLDPHVLGIRWNMLYNEFEMKHHMNLDKRMQSEPKIKTKIEFIDKKLNMIPELYDVCCKLYTGEYKKLMKELECATV